MIKILCTRAISNELIRQAASKNIIIDVKDFISVQPFIQEKDFPSIQSLIPKEKASVIFTSKHAVQILAEFISEQNLSAELPKWDIYSISNITLKKILEYFPHSTIHGNANYAEDLIEKIIENKNIREVNFFCGNIRRDIIPETLRKYGIKMNEFIIYEIIPTPCIISEKYDGYIFFSPSAVESFFSKNAIQKTSTCFAIGKTTASAIKIKTVNNIMISKEQDATSMITHVINFYQ